MVVMTSAGLVITNPDAGSGGNLKAIEEMASKAFVDSSFQTNPVLKDTKPLKVGDWIDIPRVKPDPGHLGDTHDRVWVCKDGFSLQAPPPDSYSTQRN